LNLDKLNDFDRKRIVLLNSIANIKVTEFSFSLWNDLILT